MPILTRYPSANRILRPAAVLVTESVVAVTSLLKRTPFCELVMVTGPLAEPPSVPRVTRPPALSTVSPPVRCAISAMAMVAPGVDPASTVSELLPTTRVTLMAAELPGEVVSRITGASRETVEMVIGEPCVTTVPPTLSSATAEVLKAPSTLVISSAASPSCVR